MGARELTAQGQDRKDELLRAAEALFVEKGFAETRMADIAEAAGVAKGLAYWYFDSKVALLAELVTDLRDRLRAAQGAAIVGLDDPLQRLYAGTVASVRFVAAHHRLYGLINYVSHDPKARGHAVKAAGDHDRDAAVTIAEGQARGVVRGDDDALALAIANAGVVGQMVTAWALGQLGEDADDAAQLAGRYVVRALAATTELADAAIAEAYRRMA